MSGLVYIPEPTLIISELLTFVCSATNNSSWENIKDICSEFYSLKQLADASKILFDNVGLLVPEIRASTRVTDKDGHLKNISIVISKLIAEEIATPVKFCAHDISQLPRVKPEYINRESMASDIAVLKAEMKEMMNRVGLNTGRLDSFKAQTTYATAAATAAVPPSQPSHPPIATNMTKGRNVPINATSSAGMSLQPESAVAAASDTVSKEIWQNTRDERKRQFRQKVKQAEDNGRVMIGRASGSSVAASFPSTIMFVSNVHKDVSEDILRKHITDNGIYVFNVRCVSHKDSYRNSFKVGVKESHVEKMFDETIWAEGIKVREWLSNRD